LGLESAGAARAEGATAPEVFLEPFFESRGDNEWKMELIRQARANAQDMDELIHGT
jgi:hypothetical protein